MNRFVMIDWLRARIIIQQTDLDMIDFKDASLESIIENDAYDTEQIDVERIPIKWLVAFKKVRWPPALLESARLQAGPDGLGSVEDSISAAGLDRRLEDYESRDTMYYSSHEQNRRNPAPKPAVRNVSARRPIKRMHPRPRSDEFDVVDDERREDEHDGDSERVFEHDEYDDGADDAVDYVNNNNNGDVDAHEKHQPRQQ